jgi:hypothetical protein
MPKLFQAFGFAAATFAIGVSAIANTGNNLVGEAIVLRTLDKVTATTQDYTVKIGDTLEYGSLTIAARHCEKRPPEEIPETYAFLQITDKRLKGTGEEAENSDKIFSGWMFASKPAISALDHRVYDVWVIDCKIPPKLDSDFRR